MFLAIGRARVLVKLRGAIAVVIIAGATAGWQSQRRGESVAPSAPLRSFLRAYLGRTGGAVDPTTRYQFALVDLDGSGRKDVVAYITGRSWCGTGGCTTLVLAPQGHSYRVVSRIPISRPPIRVLAATTKGWHDLGVWVQGGGIAPGYEADLPFDGKSYATSPSVPPARRAIDGAAGETVISASDEGTPLY